MSNTEQKNLLLKHYDVLVAPQITEKATSLSENNQYVFQISPSADKKSVKESVEGLYKVKVLSVNTVKTKGKATRFKGRIGKRNDLRKAIVRIAAGQTIDLSVGI